MTLLSIIFADGKSFTHTKQTYIKTQSLPRMSIAFQKDDSGRFAAIATDIDDRLL